MKEKERKNEREREKEREGGSELEVLHSVWWLYLSEWDKDGKTGCFLHMPNEKKESSGDSW